MFEDNLLSLMLPTGTTFEDLADPVDSVTGTAVEWSQSRFPVVEIEQVVRGQVHQWLLDQGSIYKSTAAWLPDSSIQQRLIARAAEIGKCWAELPVDASVLFSLP